MGTLIPFDPHGCQAVTEVDLWNVIALQEKVATAQAKIDVIAAGLVDRLKAGTPIEDDCQYTARLEVVQTAGVREERLMIDGVCRWRRVAGSAAAIRRQAHILATEPL